MKLEYTHEDGKYYYGLCNNCGNELRIMRAYCIKGKDGIKSNRPIGCSCGMSYDFINVYQKSTHHSDNTEEQIRCPRCFSTQLTAGNKGFGLGKAAAGGLLLGPVGLLGGVIGSKKVMVTCLKCGNRWTAGQNQYLN